ncbi:Topoisomerase 1-associated factor 1 [Tulasnella sp. 418]|nr:Topoisomerase 1-associated factor 1 [Tulasnella sp. 418]
MFNPWNNLLLEIFYLLFRGVNPVSLTLNQRQKTKEDLKNLLDVEAKSKREDRKHSSSRHSRFGTTITVKSGNEQFIMHSQQALTADTTSVMDMAKKKVTKRVKKLDELGGNSFLNVDALISLQTFAKGFITNCFNRFLSSLLKDIRAERAKITEKDNLRLLFVAKWFLEFFLHIREKEGEATWRFTFVSEVVDETWVPWVLRRMREAQDDKPKQWTELRAGVDCLTQLLLLIECMSSSKDDAFAEVSQALQHKLYYNGEILDLAFETLKSYKEGSQSIAYLDSTIHLGYVLLRVLEKWAKTRGEMVVRRKKKAKNKKKKAKGVTEEEGIVDVASEEEMEEVNEEHEYRESMTTFEVYEARFANPDVTNTCLFYLSRYKEYDSPERMKRVVGLLHRQAVKVKAEGLFFQVNIPPLSQRL